MPIVIALVALLFIAGLLLVGMVSWMAVRAYRHQKATIGFKVQGYPWPEVKEKPGPGLGNEHHDDD